MNIEIEITPRCSQTCNKCIKFSNYSNPNDDLYASQIYTFINQSIEHDINWENISITGGEPTLNENIIDICQALLAYKHMKSPKTTITVISSLPKTKRIIKQLPSGVNHSPRVVDICNFQIEPNCKSTIVSLNSYGFYPCSFAGSLDRIFGYNLGLKKIDLQVLLSKSNSLCQLCREQQLERNNKITTQLEKYKIERKQLTFF